MWIRPLQQNHSPQHAIVIRGHALKKPRVNAMSGPRRKTHEWPMSVLLLGTPHSDPFLRKQIASSIFKTKMSSMSSSSEWFRVQKSGLWDPLLRGWGKKWFTDRFWFSFFTQFNFIGPITWVRLNENFWEVEADSQTHSLHTAIRPMAAEFHILRSCLAVSDKHHPEQLPGKHERGFLSAVRFLGGQEEMGPDMKD